jgi:hypothetical protein
MIPSADTAKAATSTSRLRIAEEAKQRKEDFFNNRELKFQSTLTRLEKKIEEAISRGQEGITDYWGTSYYDDEAIWDGELPYSFRNRIIDHLVGLGYNAFVYEDREENHEKRLMINVNWAD